MKHYRINIMPTARTGLLDIAEYIALDNPVRAMSFIDEIVASLQKTLPFFPYSGQVAQGLDVDEEIRVWPHGNYNSYYRILEDQKLIEVLFVFHFSRDVQALISRL